MNPYVVFLLYMLAILGFVAVTLLLNRVLGPKSASSAMKLEPFECGATPVDVRNVKAVPIKYYAVAIIFILFDLETVFPVHLGAGRTAGDRLHAGDVRNLHLSPRADPALCLQGAAARGGDGVGMARAPATIPIQSVGGKSAAFEYLTTKKDELVGWARKFSLFPYPFVTACCAMEFMAVSSSPYDTDRFGAALPRFSPRQADLLMVVGTVTHKQAPVLYRVYEQMCEPKWVMAFGVCATSGGFYQNYAAVQGIDRIIPVDVYVPGCPPRPGDGDRRHHAAAGQDCPCAASDRDQGLLMGAMLGPLQLRLAVIRLRGRADPRHAGGALPPDRLLDTVRLLKDEFRFDLFLDVTAIDWLPRQPRFDVVYHFYSTTHFVRVRLKVAVTDGAAHGRLAGFTVWLGLHHGTRVPRNVRHRLSRQCGSAAHVALRGLRRASAAQGLSEAPGATAGALSKMSGSERK